MRKLAKGTQMLESLINLKTKQLVLITLRRSAKTIKIQAAYRAH